MFKVRNKKTYVKHVRRNINTSSRPKVTKTVHVEINGKPMTLTEVLVEKKQVLATNIPDSKTETSTVVIDNPVVIMDNKKAEEEFADIIKEMVMEGIEKSEETENSGSEDVKPKKKTRKRKTENKETKE